MAEASEKSIVAQLSLPTHWKFFPIDRYIPTQGLAKERGKVVTASEAATMWANGYDSMNKLLKRKRGEGDPMNEFLRRKCEMGTMNEPKILTQVAERFQGTYINLPGYWEMSYTGATPDGILLLPEENIFSPWPTICLVECKTTEEALPRNLSTRVMAQVIVQMMATGCPYCIIAYSQVGHHVSYSRQWAMFWDESVQRVMDVMAEDFIYWKGVIANPINEKIRIKSGKGPFYENLFSKIIVISL